VRSLINIVANADYCALITKGDSSTSWVIILCNSIGSPVDSREINIEPIYYAMSKTHIVICNKGAVFLWRYRKQTTNTVIEVDKKKVG